MDNSEFSPLFHEVLGCLIHNLFHNLNNPLSAIIGFSSKNRIKPSNSSEDWEIVYQQGKLLSERIKNWQYLVKKQLPQFIGNLCDSGDFVLKCFAPAFSGNLSINWNYIRENQCKCCVDLAMHIQIYFWTFLFGYFLNTINDETKGLLNLSITKTDSQVKINAELLAEIKEETEFTSRLCNAWKTMLIKQKYEPVCELKRWSVILRASQ